MNKVSSEEEIKRKLIHTTRRCIRTSDDGDAKSMLHKFGFTNSVGTTPVITQWSA